MTPSLTISEAVRSEKYMLHATAASLDGAWAYAWVHKRGALDGAAGDGGSDLVVVSPPSSFPRVALGGAKALSAAAFSADGERFLVAVDGRELVVGHTRSLRVATWLRAEHGEKLDGASWASDDASAALVAATGADGRARLHLTTAPPPAFGDDGAPADAPADADAARDAARSRRELFAAERGGGLLSWDRSPVAPSDSHRYATAAPRRLPPRRATRATRRRAGTTAFPSCAPPRPRTSRPLERR